MPDQYNLPPPSDTEKIWTALGLSPQTFPIYYPMGAQPFLGGNGQPSGASGATARLTRDLSNFPHMFMGLRISNVYALGDDPSAEVCALAATGRARMHAVITGVTIRSFIIQSSSSFRLVTLRVARGGDRRES